MFKKLTYRKFISSALLLIYLLNVCKIVLPYLAYKLNYKYISTVLCENRNKPIKLCNGSCYVAKEIKKATEKDAKDQFSFKGFEADQLSCGELVFTSFIFSEEKAFGDYSPPAYLSLSREIESPPPEFDFNKKIL